MQNFGPNLIFISKDLKNIFWSFIHWIYMFNQTYRKRHCVPGPISQDGRRNI